MRAPSRQEDKAKAAREEKIGKVPTKGSRMKETEGKEAQRKGSIRNGKRRTSEAFRAFPLLPKKVEHQSNPSTSPSAALLGGSEEILEERQEVEDRLAGQCEVEAATMAEGSKAADVSAAIEELIASAMDGAQRLEGSNPGLQPGDSEKFHFLLHECVKSWLFVRSGGCCGLKFNH